MTENAGHAELVINVAVDRQSEGTFRSAAMAKLTQDETRRAMGAAGLVSVRLCQPVLAADPVPWEIRLEFTSLVEMARFSEASNEDSGDEAGSARRQLLSIVDKIQRLKGVQTRMRE